MTDEEALQFAQRMRPFHRSVLLFCSKATSFGYTRMAEKLGVAYEDVQAVGHWLQKKRLATIEYVHHGGEFAGSRIFLSDRGEHVRMAADILTRKSSAQH